MMRPFSRLPRTALATLLVSTLVLPAISSSAATGSTAAPGSTPILREQQLVTAQLDPSGLPDEASIITRLVAVDAPAEAVPVETSTSNVRFLDRAGAPVVDGDTVLFPIGGPGETTAATIAGFRQPLPIAVHVRYATVSGADDGGFNPADLPQTAGPVRVTYTVTNTNVEREAITYTNAAGRTKTQELPVFAPFIGSLRVIVSRGTAVEGTGEAVVSTTDDGNTVLDWPLVLYPPIGDYRAQVGFTINGPELAAPAAELIAAPIRNPQDPGTAFVADTLNATVDGNRKLADGVDQLDVAAGELAAGALQLEEGQNRLTDGQRQLTRGTGEAAAGAAQVADGSAAIASGLGQLSAALDQLSGPAGLQAIRDGSVALAAAVDQLAAAVGSADDPPIPLPSPGEPFPPNITMVQAVRLISEAVNAARLAAASGASDAAAAGVKVAEVLASACAPPTPTLDPNNCQKLVEAEVGIGSSALKSGAAALGLQAINNQAISRLLAAVIQVGEALKSGDPSAPGIYEGQVQLSEALKQAATAAEQMATESARASSASDDLADGAGDLSTGLDVLTDASGQLVEGSERLAEGAGKLAEGSQRLHKDGTSALYRQIVSASNDPALADAYLRAASRRAADSAPYPPPAGAQTTVAYHYTLQPNPPEPTISLATAAIAGIFILGFGFLVYWRLRTYGQNLTPVAHHDGSGEIR